MRQATIVRDHTGVPEFRLFDQLEVARGGQRQNTVASEGRDVGNSQAVGAIATSTHRDLSGEGFVPRIPDGSGKSAASDSGNSAAPRKKERPE